MTSGARQREQAATLVAGHGQIVAEFFDIGYSRTLTWARRPQAAALPPKASAHREAASARRLAP